MTAFVHGNGSLIREQFVRLGVPNKETRYGWDGQNRLTSIAYNHLNRPSWLPALPDNRLEFAYSDDGNRVKKSVNGVATYYLNDGLSVLNELNDTGAITKSIVKSAQGGEQIADIGANGVVKYLHQDALGSTSLMTDSSGAVIQKYEYDPFGRLVGSEGNEENKYQFTGQEYDPESELAYMNARYYNPRIGRFLSRDTRLGAVGDLLSRNPYIYVKNNPMKYTDPSGGEEENAVTDDAAIDNDRTEDLINRMISAAEKMQSLNQWYIPTAYKYGYFAYKVRQGGEWDIKRLGEFAKLGVNVDINGTKKIPHVLISGVLVSHDVPGNFMFGYAGAAGGIPSSHLLSGAFGVQIVGDIKNQIASELKNYTIPSLEDVATQLVLNAIPNELGDGRYIKAGFDLYQKYGSSIDAKRIKEFIFSNVKPEIL